MINYDARQIRQGNKIKKEAEENASTFATEGGSSFSMPNQSLDARNRTRMAGPGGAFAIALMEDKELDNRVYNWGSAFRNTKEGAEFYMLNNEEPV